MTQLEKRNVSEYHSEQTFPRHHSQSALVPSGMDASAFTASLTNGFSRVFSVATLALLLSLFISNSAHADKPIKAQDADEEKVVLNQKGRLSVIIYSSQPMQKRTRKVAKYIDELQGMSDLMVHVLVDLRGTLASIFKGTARKQIRKNLDKEAKRLKPFFEKNGSTIKPRDVVSAIPDFGGKICKKIGWKEPGEDKLPVMVYNRKGERIKRWNDVNEKNREEFLEFVRKAINDGQ